MKKIAALLTAVAAAASMTVSAFAAAPSVYLDGTRMTFDAEPFIEGDRTLVPLRAIFEACGADVVWDQDTLTAMGAKEITAEDGTTSVSTVVLQIGNKKAYIDGNEVELDVPGKVVSDRTFVPLRFVSEALKAKVDWNQEELRVDITTK